MEAGDLVQVKVNGEIVSAIFQDWRPCGKYAVVLFGDKRIYRKPINSSNFSAKPAQQSLYHINERFEFIENIVDMVALGESKSAIISGSGGLGKTHTVLGRLHKAGFQEEIDYKMVKGFTTPKSLYRLLFTNQDKIIIFDDTDSVWQDQTAVSLLKGALDSYDVRKLSWMTSRGDDGIPETFEFKGKIIFISNLPLSKLDQAVLSRALYVDVSMSPQEKIDRIKFISPKIRPEIDGQVKKEVLDFLEVKADQIGDLNIRTFLKGLEIRLSGNSNWQQMFDYMATAF